MASTDDSLSDSGTDSEDVGLVQVAMACSQPVVLLQEACRPQSVQLSDHCALVSAGVRVGKQHRLETNDGKRFEENDPSALPSGMYHLTAPLPASAGSVDPCMLEIAEQLLDNNIDGGSKAEATENDSETFAEVLGRMLKDESAGIEFGSDLTTSAMVSGRQVPLLVSSCIAFLRNHLDVEGLFRIPGLSTEIDALKRAFEEGKDPLRPPQKSNGEGDAEEPEAEEGKDEGEFAPEAVGGCFKLFLRQLKEPVMTHALYADLIDVGWDDNLESRVQRLRRLVQRKLPPANKCVLSELLPFLKAVAEKSDINKMTTSNLSVVFVPTLMPPPPDDTGALLTNARPANIVLCTLIDEYAAVLDPLPEINFPFVVQAKYDYPSRTAEELSLQEGKCYTVSGQEDEHWWIGSADAGETQKFLIAASYVERMEPEEEPAPLAETCVRGHYRVIQEPSTGKVSQEGTFRVHGLPLGQDTTVWQVTRTFLHEAFLHLVIVRRYKAEYDWRGAQIPATLSGAYLAKCRHIDSFSDFDCLSEIVSPQTEVNMAPEDPVLPPWCSVHCDAVSMGPQGIAAVVATVSDVVDPDRSVDPFKLFKCATPVYGNEELAGNEVRGSWIPSGVFGPKLEPRFVYTGDTPVPGVIVCISNDNGVTWKHSQIDTRGIYPTVAFDSTAGVLLLVAAGSRFPWRGTQAAYSADFGETWARVEGLCNEQVPTSGRSSVSARGAGKFTVLLDETRPYTDRDEIAGGGADYVVKKATVAFRTKRH